MEQEEEEGGGAAGEPVHAVVTAPEMDENGKRVGDVSVRFERTRLRGNVGSCGASEPQWLMQH